MLYSSGEIGDEQFGPAVAVDVLGVDPHAGLSLALDVEGRAAILRGVAKGAVTVVQEEEIGIPVVGDIEVDLAVAVEVGRDGREAVPVRPAECRPCRSRR